MKTDWVSRLGEILEPLPTSDGGIVVVLATAGLPPAMALLSSGDVWVESNRVRVGVHGTSSTVSRLGGAFSLMVPAGAVALRVEAIDAFAQRSGGLAVLDGRLSDIRPTAEPPWITDMTFRPTRPFASAIPRHLEYWSGVREWLAGDRAEAPDPPA